MEDYYTRSKCRLCDSSDIQTVLALNESPLCDAYVQYKIQQKSYNLNLSFCNSCGFVQIDTVVDPEVIYRDYIYVTTSSSGLQKHFNKYASEVSLFLDLETASLAVDIGSNDGTLLRFFKEKGFKVLGVEPSVKTAADANNNGVETIPDFFDQKLAANIVEKFGNAKLITINNLFANIDDLTSFVKGIDLLLDDQGVLVIESSYLLEMINNMVFDFIYHEHLSYFSIIPLVGFFKQFDIHLINIQSVQTKGGSLRYFWARNNSKWGVAPIVDMMISREREANIGINIFHEFNEKIASIKKQLIEFLEQHAGEKIVGYGASATSTTLISHFKLHKYLSYLVDDNLAKIGTMSPGYHIPVKSLSEMCQDSPDVILILAWRFKGEIMKKISGISQVVVIPLPEMEIIKV